MKFGIEEENRVIGAKRNVRRVKIFYIYLATYLIGISLFLFSLYIASGSFL
jgi:hypothetical protein